MKLRKSKKLNKNTRFSVAVKFYINLPEGKLLGIPICNNPQLCDRYLPFIYTFKVKRKDVYTRTSLEKLNLKSWDGIIKLFNDHGYFNVNSYTILLITDIIEEYR